MTLLQWIGCGFGAAVLLYFFGYVRWLSRISTRMSNFTIMLLLDEFAYRRYRTEFIRLTETATTDDTDVLYYATMAELELASEKATPRRTALARRMKQIRAAALDGRSVLAPSATPDAPAAETPKPAVIGDVVGRSFAASGSHEAAEQARVEREAITGTAVKLARRMQRLRRSARNFLGIR